MQTYIGFGLLLTALTALFDESSAACKAANVGDCISQSQIGQLQQDDPDVYCLEGPQRVKQIYDCLQECQLSANGIRNLASVTLGVDDYCASHDYQCGSIAEKYVNFSQCYDGGLSAILNGIVQSFNDDNTTELYGYCQRLAWGRNCQLQIAGKCTYLQQLQSQDIASNFLLSAAFYVCGSEGGEFVYTDTSSCNGNIPALVNSQCAVSCNLESATTRDDICLYLQFQADCIWSTTKGCSPIQNQYIVPRLTSYWAANELLGCDIRINGIVVWARAERCSISLLLSACFNLSSSGVASVDAFKQLLTMQFPLSQICSLLQTHGIDRSVLLGRCVSAMTSCVIPLGQVYDWSRVDAPMSTYASPTYTPLLGPFAVNAWGLSTLFDNLQLSVCQASGHVQCGTTPGLSTVGQTTRQTPAQTKRATPPAASQRQTPKLSNSVP